MALNFKRAPEILQDMVSYLAASASALTDVNVGSATRSLLEAISVVVAEIHWLQEQLILRFFVATSFGQWLDRRAAEVDVYRVLENPTQRVLTVSHAAGAAVLIPEGHRFKTVQGSEVQVFYEVLAATTLPAGNASVDVPVISVASGAATALPDGVTLEQTGEALAGIDSVVTSTISAAGTDRESDDSLRARTLEAMRRPRGPGSKTDLHGWALEAGAADAVVLPNWDATTAAYALGHATIIVLGPGNTVPSAEVLEAVQDHIDPEPYTEGGGRAAVGARIHVIAPSTVPIDVTVTVEAADGYVEADVLAQVQANVAAVINGLTMKQKVKYAELANAVWDTDGVHDGGNYSYLRLRRDSQDFAPDDIAMGDTEKPVSNSVVASAA